MITIAKVWIYTFALYANEGGNANLALTTGKAVYASYEACEERLRGVVNGFPKGQVVTLDTATANIPDMYIFRKDNITAFTVFNSKGGAVLSARCIAEEVE